jgi:hypothetical protein
MSITKMKVGYLDLFDFSKTSRIHALSLSTGKSIYHPSLTSTKMTPPNPVKPCPGINDQEVGIDKKPYSIPTQPL